MRRTTDARWTRESETVASPVFPPAHLSPRSSMARRFVRVALCIALSALARPVHAQTPPPAPVLIQPNAGAVLVQPITLAWSAVVDPDGPIGSYTWQVSTTSTFASVIASGFTNAPADGLQPR